MSYCMYLRKSRADLEAEARGEGETLKRHENVLLELAKRMKINISSIAIYKEVISGETISSRPIMQQLLTEVEQGKWKGVLVVEVERLARGDTIDQGIVAQAFKYTNTKIVTPMKIYDPSNEFDEEYFEFGLFMSRREYKTINRRLQQGRIQSVREGKYLGTIAPFGYSRKKLEGQKGFTLEINEEQAPIVQLIFDLYTNSNRIGVSLISRKLNDMKIPTSKGGDWTTSTLRGILSNPVYIGKIRWNSRPEVKKVVEGEIITERPRAKVEDIILVEGLHSPIINGDIFELAQENLSQNPSVPVPNRHKVKNPLAGIIICGICGRKMNRRPHQGDYPDTLMCVGPTCPNVSSHLHLVEERLLQSLEVWLCNHRLEFEENKKSENDLQLDIIERSIKNLDAELEVLNKQLDNMYDLLEQGVYSADIFIQRSKTVSDKIDTISKDKNYLVNQIKLEENNKMNKEIIIPKLERIIESYNTLNDPADKNKLLKEVLEKATYIKTVNGRWHNRPDDFSIDLYPKLIK